MKIQTSKNDWLVIVIVMMLSGVVLGAAGFTAFYDAARHDTGVAWFLLGYTFLWSGMMRWGQRRHDEALIKTGMMLGEMSEKAKVQPPNRHP